MEQKNEYKNSETVKDKKSNKGFIGFLNIIKGYIILFFITSILHVVILRFIPPQFTFLMFSRAIENLASGKSPFFKNGWTPIDKISPQVQLAIISSEDQNFPNHFGVDFRELKKAYKSKNRKRIRGASTISQQVAKNVFLFPARSFIRKGFELYYAILIETFWGKRRILETYLNVVEMGNGIFGIEAAASKYFKKEPIEITRNEASAIAAILPNPRKYSVTNPSSYLLKRRVWIRRQMGSLGKKYLEKID